jgi:hypothetical protein
VNPEAVIRAINTYREASVRRAFKNTIGTLQAPRSPARPIRNFFAAEYSHIPSHWGGWGMYM